VPAKLAPGGFARTMQIVGEHARLDISLGNRHEQDADLIVALGISVARLHGRGPEAFGGNSNSKRNGHMPPSASGAGIRRHETVGRTRYENHPSRTGRQRGKIV
jgi:hypothetical protein